LSLIASGAKAQVRGFGNIDTADLRLTSCNFEKDANAMVLFDEAKVYYKFSTVVMERHKRIKIFNDKGKDEAKVRIEYYGKNHNEQISEIEAQTINLNNNAVEYAPVDKTLIYTQDVDKDKKAVIFTFSNVKPGSVVEFKYKWSTPYAGNFPNWFFQADIPTRYSEFQSDFSKDYTFKFIKTLHQKLTRDTAFFKNGKNYNQGRIYIWALSNVHSMRDEPYMTSTGENIQSILFQVSSPYRSNSWSSIIYDMLKYDEFGKQLDTSIYLNNEEKILAKVNSFQNTDEKIAYVFNLVKSTVKYNDFTGAFTDDGIRKAWNKKVGNAAELNLIIFHFLKKSGVNVYAMAVNTDSKIETRYASIYQFNKTVDYIQVDSTREYILDAANKYNAYNAVPFYLLNSNGLLIDAAKKFSNFITLKNNLPIKKVVFVNAEIMPGGKMSGSAQLNNFGYSKIDAVKKYKDDGEKKFIDYLRDDDNNLKISSLKLENMEVDSLPLTQNIEFNLDLTGSDDNYVFFSPNLFTGLNINPFLSEERLSDIDFKYLNNYTISGRYKIPAGYKIEALPKNINLVMPDKSITLKRVVGSDGGFILVHYVIAFKRSVYSKDEYPELRAFYKQLHELLNEQIVLKKT
jgi:hypothetical protein